MKELEEQIGSLMQTNEHLNDEIQQHTDNIATKEENKNEIIDLVVKANQAFANEN